MIFQTLCFRQKQALGRLAIADQRDHICWSVREYVLKRVSYESKLAKRLETADHLDMNGLSSRALWQGTLRFFSKYLFFFTAPVKIEITLY